MKKFTKEVSAERDKYLDLLQETRSEIHKVIIGMDELVTCLLVGLYVPPRQPGQPFGGNILIEGSHGKGKSFLVEVIARCIGLDFEIFQGDPEKMPTDITGFECRDPNNPADDTCMIFEKGPIFSDLVLADEINRINPKCQSAFLRPMEERQVVINGKKYILSEFLRIYATINPIEEQGKSVWDLPAAQKDRFFINYAVERLTFEQNLKVTSGDIQPLSAVKKNVLNKEDIKKISRFIDVNYADKRLYEITAKIGEKSMDHEKIQVGSSPRANSDIRRLSKCLAFMSGEDMVLPEHVVLASLLSLRDRMTLRNEYSSDSTEIILDILGKIPLIGV